LNRYTRITGGDDYTELVFKLTKVAIDVGSIPIETRVTKASSVEKLN
jgi:hypothetical protein